jgi:hypothetical protein
MLENVALYSRTYDSLSEDRMLALVDDIRPSSEIMDRGLTYTNRCVITIYPDITISELPCE